MLNILICDDDIKFIELLKEKIRQVCKNKGIEYEVTYYLSPIDILKEDGLNNVNVIFLDIDMPKMNGFAFAQQLKGVNIHIIFVSNRDELVFQSMKYHPFYFMRKNYINDEVERQIMEINQMIQDSSKKIIVIDTSTGSQRIEISRILYIENIKNYINIYTINDEILTIRKSMKEMEHDLSKEGFIRVQAGYIINVGYVKRFNHKEVELVNDKIIPISRSKSKLVKDKIMEEIWNG